MSKYADIRKQREAQAEGSVVSTKEDCPICKARREARTKAQQRWRAKKQKKVVSTTEPKPPFPE